MSSPNSTTIWFNWRDLNDFALGIVVKWITLAQHKTELFVNCIFVRSRARNWRREVFDWTAICHMKREIPTRIICNLKRAAVWVTVLVSCCQLKMFYDVYCQHFPQNEWKGQDRIIVNCGSRYLGVQLQSAFVESAYEKEKEHFIPYCSHFRKHMKNNSLKWLR
jgi:hypothetical protein